MIKQYIATNKTGQDLITLEDMQCGMVFQVFMEVNGHTYICVEGEADAVNDWVRRVEGTTLDESSCSAFVTSMYRYENDQAKRLDDMEILLTDIIGGRL